MDERPIIQVSPRLIKNLLRSENAAPEQPRQRKRRPRPTPEQLGTADVTPLEASAAAPPSFGFLPGLAFGVPLATSAEHQHAAALADIKAATEEVRHVSAAIEAENSKRMDRVKEMAAELHAKQFRPPSKQPLCLEERKACAACYREHTKEPLRCADVVEQFVTCARVAEAAFVSAQR